MNKVWLTYKNIIIMFLLALEVILLGTVIVSSIDTFLLDRQPTSVTQVVSVASTEPVVASEETPIATSTPVVIPKPSPSPYIEIVTSCGPYFTGECVNLRSGPGTSYPVVKQLRTGIILKVAETVEREGRKWYKIDIDDYLRHPDRVIGDWYVAADLVELFYNEGDKLYKKEGNPPIIRKSILVDLSEEKLYAYEGEELFMEVIVSTGLDASPTPQGTFTVFKKTPSRYMQGPIDGISTDYYDLPGVPWNLYFTAEGAVVHGAYWHDNYGQPWSHGCVNLPPQKAKELYLWAEVGMPIIVRE